jgi:large subunit ribosomal protein L44
VLQRYNLEKPQSRLIAETGRLSQNAVFGVGVYSGSRKVGEGWGSAIRMAEYRVSR